MLQQLVAGTLSRFHMLPPDARVGVADSGGADSVCLLHLLHRLAPDLGISLHVLHLDHCLRGEESCADAQFVAGTAGDLGLPCTVEQRLVAEDGGNLEEDARHARHDFFHRMMQAHGLQRVATGHTLSDQAETVLFRILRGSGPGGLAGILPVTAEGLVRPLIEAGRDEVRQWLQSEGIHWREDSSNLDARFARNRIRHELLPEMLRHVHPGAAQALARLASIAGEEEDYWRPLVATELAGAGEGPVVLETGSLGFLHPALARRVVREALRRAAGSLRGVSLEHVEAVLALARQQPGRGRLALPGITVQRSFNWLRLAGAGDLPPADWQISLSGPGPAGAGAVRLEVTEKQTLSLPEPERSDSLYNEVSHRLDARVVSFPLLLRNWRAGDSYQPLGRLRPVKLKEMFHEARVPSWKRAGWPMVVWKDRIVWSRKFGVAAWAAAGAECRSVLCVREVGEAAAASER
ncbi:MAG: tRNA lysidine(34) synthetase TilS [Acidobacteria bacterium]|nr:tRNA lysidine(34) synthetase TilS [Acidobacteriota bacterium]